MTLSEFLFKVEMTDQESNRALVPFTYLRTEECQQRLPNASATQFRSDEFCAEPSYGGTESLLLFHSSWGKVNFCVN